MTPAVAILVSGIADFLMIREADLAPDLCLKIITSQDCFPNTSGQPVKYDRFAMLRIPQLMDEPSKSNVDKLFGAKEVSQSVTASASLEFFKEHGLFYTENAAVGGIVDALDQQGLSSSPDSFKFFSGCIIGDDVRIGDKGR